jgi:endo-1,4-beta-xylanase
MKKRQLFTVTSVISFLFIVSAAILFPGCGTTKGNVSEVDSLKGLKDYYKDYFPIGVAVSPSSLQGEQGEMIKRQFNSLTAENVMKPALIQPEEGKFVWDNADKIVNFAQENGMKVRGHTLCWHSQTGEWMFKDAQGNQASKELALKRLEEHIKQVVTRYKGKVYGWDVCNEVIDNSDDPSKVYRESLWYKICGDEYISKAFQWAHEADPDAILFYNDYNTENPVKREKIYTMLKKMLDAGVPVNAIGLQAHWNINGPSQEAIKESIDKFSSLGLKVQFTELDVPVYFPPNDTIGKGFTPEKEQKQADEYKMAFNTFRENKNVITGVTFWNVSDKGSWLDRRAGRKTYPLLFDENLKPKKVFWEVVKF